MREWKYNLLYNGMTALLIPVGLFFINGHYDLQDVLIIIKQASFLFYAVLGAAVLQISGEFLLCSGAIIALNMTLAQILYFNLHVSAFWISVATFALAGLIGLFLGAFGVGLGIPSLILTFAMEFILRGVGNGLNSQLAVSSATSTAFSFLTSGSILSVPFWLIVSVVMVFLAYVFLYKTYLGRCIFAVGSDMKAASRAGLSARTVKIIMYVIGCSIVNISTLFMLSSNSFGGSNFASSTSFDALVVLCLGGISLHGGKGRLRELLFAVLCFTMLQSIFTTLSIPIINFQITKGVILMTTLWVQNKNRIKRNQGSNLPKYSNVA